MKTCGCVAQTEEKVDDQVEWEGTVKAYSIISRFYHG
jgi:hypothetical protein